MSEPRKQVGPRTFSLITIVQWVWLVGLSVLIVIGWRPSSTDAGSAMWEAVTAHLKAFETRISALEESNQARLVQAPSATQQALQGLRETLEARLERLEKPAGEDTSSVALDVLRSEVEMLKGQLTALKSAAASPPKTSKTVRPARQAVAKEEPLPFRVLELSGVPAGSACRSRPPKAPWRRARSKLCCQASRWASGVWSLWTAMQPYSVPASKPVAWSCPNGAPRHEDPDSRRWPAAGDRVAFALGARTARYHDSA